MTKKKYKEIILEEREDGYVSYTAEVKEERDRWQEFKDSFSPIINFFKWLFSDHS